MPTNQAAIMEAPMNRAEQAEICTPLAPKSFRMEEVKELAVAKRIRW